MVTSHCAGAHAYCIAVVPFQNAKKHGLPVAAILGVGGMIVGQAGCQCLPLVGNRAPTRQRLRMGTDREGALTVIRKIPRQPIIQTVLSGIVRGCW
jgi:hypothetical protein